MKNNNIYKRKNKQLDFAFTFKNFYVYNNYGDDSFTIIEKLDIKKIENVSILLERGLKMEKLSEMETTIIQGLKYLKVEEEAIIGIMLLIQEEWQVIEMGSYLYDNPQATQEEILLKAVEIHNMH